MAYALVGPLASLLLPAMATPALLLALDPSKPIHQFGHRSWTVEDGLPQSSVTDIEQTPDGSLSHGMCPDCYQDYVREAFGDSA